MNGLETRTAPSPRDTLARRLLVAYLVGLSAVVAVVAVPLDRSLERTFLDDLTDSLSSDAKAIRFALPPEDGRLQPAIQLISRELDERITIIRSDGLVLADSERDPASIENHASRPEVRAALEGRIGVASRQSETVGRPFRYVALPPAGDRIIRVALPLDRVQARLGRIRTLVAVGAAIAFIVGVAAAWLTARRMTRPLHRMTQAASAIGAGDLTAHVPEEGGAELAQLAATVNIMATRLRALIDEAREDRNTRDVVLAAMDDGVVLIGVDEDVQYANPAAARLVGRIAADGASQSEEAPLYVPPVLRTLVEASRSTGEVRARELDLGHPPRTVHAGAFPVGSDGLVLIVLRDVTEARRLDEVRRDFVAAASHELKTPVASIQATSETLELALEEDPRAAKRFVQNLVRDAERLSRIVRDLLDLSRLETERGPIEPVRLDLLAREETERLRERARQADLELDVDAMATTVPGSRKDLSLLISNLLDNAIRYTKPGGRVALRVITENGTALLSISDSGIGIPARDLPRIFERFYRVDRARSRETGGTGLGLAIVKHVAEQHGGTVEASSELGTGTTFRVTLPSI